MSLLRHLPGARAMDAAPPPRARAWASLANALRPAAPHARRARAWHTLCNTLRGAATPTKGRARVQPLGKLTVDDFAAKSAAQH